MERPAVFKSAPPACKFAIFFLVALFLNLHSQASTYYVKANATGSNNGSSWANAYTNLYSALNLTLAAGDTVKVAKGTYVPQAGNFFALRSGAVLLGGYPNTGNPSDAERNWSLNQTILSGTNNHSFVLANFNFLSSGTLIDGFIVEGGNNSGNTPGAGLRLLNSNPVIKNCVFRNNRTGILGGSNAACDSSKPVFLNCFFINSYDGKYGSVYCTRNSAPVFTNCVFSRNTAPGLIAADHSTLKFFNCNFVNNTIGQSGLYNSLGYATIVGDNNASITISNSVFWGNNYSGYTDSADVLLVSSSLNISSTITQNLNYGNTALLAANPKFRDTSNIAGADGLYFTADDGLQLLNPSVAINKGDNTSVAGVVTDIAGSTRIFGSAVDIGAYEVQTALSAPTPVLYVNPLATGLNNGSSWANAFTNLQSAFNNSSDTIKVAKGIYYTSASNKYASFWLEKNRVVLGGYPDTGNPGDNLRNPSQYPTILSGKLPSGNPELYTRVIVNGKNVDSTSILDGFRLQDANDEYTSHAAIMFNRFGSGIVRNCSFINILRAVSIEVRDSSHPKFYDCVLDSVGGAVNLDNCNPLYKRCSFKKGGGIYNTGANSIIDSCLFYKVGRGMWNINSNPVVSNSKFYGNLGNWEVYIAIAPDMLNDNSSPIVTNCLFSDSVLTDHAGSIKNINGSNPSFTNCEFRNGRASLWGGFCYNKLSSPTFNKCVFLNGLGGLGGAFYNLENSNPLLVNCIAIGNRTGYANHYDGEFMYTAVNCSPVIINSTIVNHTATVAEGTAAIFYVGGSSQLTLNNSILWNNVQLTVNNLGKEIHIQDPALSSATVNNTITQAYGSTGQNGILRNADPRFIDITNPTGPDNKFFTADDGLRLCSCSPAINKGNNTLANGYTTDILNNPRIASSIIDMGAYEFQSAATNTGTFYVNASASGINNGQSWAGAYTKLQAAIQNPCADTIKIAMGTYKPAVTSRDSTFNINRGLVMYGGYPNTGNPTNAQRNADLYPSVLSGNVGAASDSTDNSNNVLWVHCIDTSVVIDGVTIERGTANSGNVIVIQNGLCGGGIYAYGNRNLKISNCVFRNNYAWQGSAIYSAYNVLDINKCIFKNNNTDIGTVNILNYGITTKVRNSVFHNNNTAGFAAGVFIETAATLENLLFYKNEGFRGVGVYIQGTPDDTQSPKITNCNFVKNNSNTTSFGIGLYFNKGNGTAFGSPIIRNCIFKDNTFSNNVPVTVNADWATSGNNPDVLNLQYCATNTGFTYTNNISPNSVTFKDINSGIGLDNKWFTKDDGLIPAICSNTYNKGENAAVTNIPFDIMDSTRIMNGIVDIGAYEYRKSAVTITASDTLVCPGTLVTFNATVLNTTLNPVYTWRVNSVVAGTNSHTFSSSTLNNNDTVDVRIITTDPVCGTAADTAFSNRIIIRLTSTIVPAVSIAASSTTICAGTSVTFTATPVNGGPGHSYQWKKNGINVGTNSNQYSSATLQQADIIQVELTSGFTCANPVTVSSNTITMTVNQVPATTVSITASANVICAGANVTFTAVPVNGGTLPAYQWMINGNNVGTNSSSFSTTALNNNDIVSVVMTGSLLCSSPATSNSISITVNAMLTPSVSITTPTTAICNGSTTTFTATPVNGGSTPFYQWQLNGINTGTNSPVYTPATLQHNDQVKLILTSSAACITQPTATSNVISISAGNPVNASVFITASSNSICPGTVATFTATANNAGSAPVYQWKKNGVNVGTNSSTYSSSTIQNGDIVSITLTSNAPCVNTATVQGNSIVMAVSSVTPTITISGNSTVAAGMTTAITSVITNAGNSFAYQWQDSTATHTWQNITNSNVPGLNFYMPVATGNKLRCLLTGVSNCANGTNSVTSNTLTFTINPPGGNIHGYIRYFPNPATRSITIDSLNLKDNWETVTIITASGAKTGIIENISGLTQASINVEALPPGIYFGILNSKFDGMVFFKFVKQ